MRSVVSTSSARLALGAVRVYAHDIGGRDLAAAHERLVDDVLAADAAGGTRHPDGIERGPPADGLANLPQMANHQHDDAVEPTRFPDGVDVVRVATKGSDGVRDRLAYVLGGDADLAARALPRSETNGE